MYQKVFKRYEIKYLLSKQQKEIILKAIEPYMQLDKYGRTIIRNIYFDTDNYLLIRRSIEKPLYKEKIRIRSYKKASNKDDVFVEIKKKYNHVVYKRRVCLNKEDAFKWLDGKQEYNNCGQIYDEINYFKELYKNLKPTIFLTYEREAYYCENDKNLRITFDDNILARKTNIDLGEDIFGTALLDDENVMMEVKCNGGIPLWLTSVLSKEKIYKTSFSKYGKAYEKLLFKELNEKIKKEN